jgi:hypothetical protein
MWRMTANKIAEVFGQRVTRKLKGKLNTVAEQIDHGHHIFRAYYRNAFISRVGNWRSAPQDRPIHCSPFPLGVPH